MTTLADQIDAHVAVAASADEIVQTFLAKMLELAASEAALRSAVVLAQPGSATFARSGQTNLAGYMIALAERLYAGDTRPEFILPVGDVAAAGWDGVA